MINPEIEKYCIAHSEAITEQMNSLLRHTYLTKLLPDMISGPLQANFLKFISIIKRPTNILEIGTFTGFATIALCEGILENGKCITIEKNKELEKELKTTFANFEKGNQIELLIGDAMQIIPTLQMKFDLVFIDADKVNNLNYYNLVIEKVNSGGIILTDNVLWHGKVLENFQDKKTKSIMSFNEFVANDSRVFKMLLPLRDGIMLVVKK